MKLTLEQIKSVTLGAVDVWEENGLVCFCRFSKEQMEMYRERRADFYKKAQEGYDRLVKELGENYRVIYSEKE